MPDFGNVGDNLSKISAFLGKPLQGVQKLTEGQVREGKKQIGKASEQFVKGQTGKAVLNYAGGGARKYLVGLLTGHTFAKVGQLGVKLSGMRGTKSLSRGDKSTIGGKVFTFPAACAAALAGGLGTLTRGLGFLASGLGHNKTIDDRAETAAQAVFSATYVTLAALASPVAMLGAVIRGQESDVASDFQTQMRVYFDPSRRG